MSLPDHHDDERAAPASTPVRTRRRAALVAALGLIAGGGAVAAVVMLRGRDHAAPRPGATLALGAARPVEVRFTAPAFAAHRPFEARASEPVPAATMSTVEGGGDALALAAARAWAGDVAGATTALERVAAGPEALADRAALALLRGEPAAALALADEALVARPDLTAARWNRALALRDLALPLAAAAELERLAAAGEPGWADEAAERARALRAPVDARRARRQEVAGRARAALLAGGPALTAADVEAAPAVVHGYLDEARRLASAPAELDALAGLSAALDAAEGGDAHARALARARGSSLATQAPFAPRYRALLAGTLAPDAIDALLRELADAGAGGDDLRLGALLAAGRAQAQLDEVTRLAAATGDPWLALRAAEERVAARRARPGEQEQTEPVCAGPGRAWPCARLDLARARVLADHGRTTEAERLARRGLARLEASSTGAEEAEALALLATIADERGQRALASGLAAEATAWLPADDCARRPRLAVLLADLARRRGDWPAVREQLAAPERCPAAVDAAGVVAATELARATQDEGDRALSSRWLVAAKAAGVPVDVLHAAQARLHLEDEAGAREVLLDIATGPAGEPAPAGPAGGERAARPASPAAGWAWQTLLGDDARRGDWNGALLHTVTAAGLAQPRPCVVTLAADDTLRVATWRDSNGTTGGARWTEPEPWPALPPAGLYGCAHTAVVALPPLHGQAPPWTLGAWAWSSRDLPAPPAAKATAKATALVVADPTPPLELLALPPPATVAVGAGERGLRGAAATPTAVAAALRTARLVELHAPALVDLAGADGGFVALSPEPAGDWQLTAAELRANALTGAPVVVLAACHRAEVAPDRRRRWSVPEALLAAGARAVLTVDASVPPEVTRALVADVRARLGRGEAPARAAAAARAALVARDAQGARWDDGVMVFE